MRQRAHGDSPGAAALARLRGGLGGCRRLVAFVALLGAILAGLPAAFPAAASADDTYLPPALLYPQTLNQPGNLYVATPEQQASLADLEQQAVTNTLSDHGLPSTDSVAAQTWGRDDAEGELWALITQAIQTPAASRTADQQNAVDWLTAVEQRQDVLSADNAGLEYAKWAGISATAYENLLATSPSEGTLQSFFSADPVNYGPGASPSSPASTSNEGYCVYVPPAPDGAQYTANIYTPSGESTADQTCFPGGCTNLLGCSPPTPSLSQFTAWGTADTADALFDTPSFAAVSKDIVNRTLGFAGSMAAAGLASGVLSSALSGELTGTAVATALSPFGGLSTGAAIGGPTAAEIAEAAGSIAAGEIAGAAGIVIAAIAVGVIETIDVVNASQLPGQLATLIPDAPTSTPDLNAALNDPDQAAGLYALFVGATAPAPAPEDSCENLGVGAVCLNAPAVPAESGLDSVFTVTQRGATSSTTGTSISFVDTTLKTTDTAWSSGNWFSMQQVDSDGSSFDAQTLELRYTDWSGADRLAWLVNGDTFVTTLADSSTPIDPSTCETDGVCTKSDAIQYVGPDGNDYSATVAPSTGIVTPASQVEIDARDTAFVGEPFTVDVSVSIAGVDPSTISSVTEFPFIVGDSADRSECFVVIVAGKGSCELTEATPGTYVLQAGGVVQAPGTFMLVQTLNGGNVVVTHPTQPVTTITLSPPAPNGQNGWYTSSVGVGISATDVGGPGVAGTRCALNPASAPASYDDLPVNGCVTTVYAGGSYTLWTASVDSLGDEETPHSVTFKLDVQPPAITYSAHPASYTVDQTVTILCTASDAVSGVAQSTCGQNSLISVPAYTLGVGSHTLTATAVDNAGNSGSASTSFSVAVTAGSVCSLTEQLAEGSSKYAALSAKQRQAVEALARAACAIVAAITPKLPAILAKLEITTYDLAVDGLKSAGWLSTAQAATLKTLAADL